MDGRMVRANRRGSQGKISRKMLIVILLVPPTFFAFSILILVLMLILPSLGQVLDLLSMPDESGIRNRVSAFLPSPGEIVPLYSNHDVDSLIIAYYTDTAFFEAKDEQVQLIQQRASQEGWTLVFESENELHFFRCLPGWKCASVEEVRVRFKDQDACYMVGWLQADSRKPVTRMEDTHEGRTFGKKKFWPKYETLCREVKGHNNRPERRIRDGE